ncbi:MAG: TolC family protein [Endomicrobia bacterium]|nr:TolC family protein [Endomicrobiia bacterium]MCL2506645.1 TolC family protein [Endomicrobiia bacterium]
MIKMIRPFLFFLICLYPFANAFGSQKITLAESEKRALETSPSVMAAKNEFNAAEAAADASKTSLLPVLSLEGQAYYLTAVPELDITLPAIGHLSKKLGDNWNYSAGLALRWNLFDGNVQKNNSEAARKLADSKKAAYENEKKKTLMNTRIAYFNLITAAANLKFIDEQLDLSISQNNDIRQGARLGSKSKLDEIMSDNEVLIKTRQKNSAKILLIGAIDNLNSLTNNIIKNYDIDLNSLDSPEALLKIFSKNIDSVFDDKNPQLLSLEMLEQYYEFISKSYENMNFPRVNVFGTSMYNYPDGPNLKSVWQNTAGADFYMPVYQFGKNTKLSKQGKFTAMSVENQRQGLYDDLRRLFDRSKEKVKILYTQIDLNKTIISQSKTVAEMTYKSYISGTSRFLDVQFMNLNVLEAQSNETDFYAGLLTELTILEALRK